jgi:hypothetical protein
MRPWIIVRRWPCIARSPEHAATCHRNDSSVSQRMGKPTDSYLDPGADMALTSSEGPAQYPRKTNEGQRRAFVFRQDLVLGETATSTGCAVSRASRCVRADGRL